MNPQANAGRASRAVLYTVPVPQKDAPVLEELARVRGLIVPDLLSELAEAAAAEQRLHPAVRAQRDHDLEQARREECMTSIPFRTGGVPIEIGHHLRYYRQHPLAAKRDYSNGAPAPGGAVLDQKPKEGGGSRATLATGRKEAVRPRNGNRSVRGPVRQAQGTPTPPKLFCSRCGRFLRPVGTSWQRRRCLGCGKLYNFPAPTGAKPWPPVERGEKA